MDFKVGEKVRVVQNGTLNVGGMAFTNNTFQGVTIVRRNVDGSYGVRGIISTPDGDVVDIPADWIYPPN